MIIDAETVLLQLISTVLINLIFVSPFLWIAGRLLVGKQKAKTTDSLWIVFIGTVVFYFLNLLLADIFSDFAIFLAYIVMLVIWLSLVKRFFDCSWLKALVISILAVILAVIILFLIFLVLTLIGLGTGWLPSVPPNSF